MRRDIKAWSFRNEKVQVISLQTPLQDDQVRKLRAGDRVRLNGILYTARDAAHKRLIDLLAQGQPLPFDIKGHLIYYTGPTPARPGRIIGSVGPTTASRMDPYAPELLKIGCKGMIGKGEMGENVRQALSQYCAVYFTAVGGAGALLAGTILQNEIIAYPELGPEAVRRLHVENFPVIVAQDCHGGNVFQTEIVKYQKRVS
jgi:fumarate hydratase subunit beta